jgi:hypothetical protein
VQESANRKLSITAANNIGHIMSSTSHNKETGELLHIDWIVRFGRNADDLTTDLKVLISK